MKNFIDKNIKIIILGLLGVAIVLIGILTYFIIGSKLSVKKFENDILTFKYDTSWKIFKESSNNIELKNGNNALLNISVKLLGEEQRYSNLDQLVEEIEFNVNKQNESYSLIAKEKTTVTRKNTYGYKFLYEKENNQALVIVTKIEDKIVVFTYLSSNNYFDILLDSVHNIIYNFEINKEKIILGTEIKKLETTNINWSGNTKVIDTREYFIASNNHIVNYKIPSQFKLASFDNTINQFSLGEGISNSIRLVISISGINMYEWLYSPDSILGIQKEIENLEKYNTDVKTEISENDLYEGSYIYRITYNSFNKYTNKTNKYEDVFIAYPLDYARVFIVEINSNDTPVSSDIINNINITKKNKIAKFIYRNIEDGYVVNELKSSFGDSKEYLNIKIQTSEEWQEMETKFNVYETRKFGLNCSEDYEGVCEYNLTYNLRKGYSKTGEEIIDSARDDFTDSKPIYRGKVSYNGKSYESYSLEYIKRVYGTKTQDHRFYETILYEELDDGYVFIIKLNRIDFPDITNKINEMLKYDINKEIYN